MSTPPEYYNLTWQYEIDVDNEHIQPDYAGYSDFNEDADLDYYGNSE